MNEPPRKFFVSAAFVLCAAALFSTAARADVKILVVNVPTDHDDGECTVDDCTLREAILSANDDGSDTQIEFGLPDPHFVGITSPLPPLTEDGTVIDGTTETHFTGEPVIVLAPDPLDSQPIGLEIRASRCVVRGIAINNFSATPGAIAGAVYISGGTDNVVEKNHLGISPILGVAGNTIGVHLAADGQTVRDNVVSHNGKGIFVAEGYGKITILGNKIGTDSTGTKPEPNTVGIWLEQDTNEIVIGSPGRGNLISGNDGMGIAAKGYRHVIRANWIGVDASGSIALPNLSGIQIAGPADGFVIGGDGAGEGNVVSGNGDAGILIGDGRHTIQGNRIGTTADGRSALGNIDGIVLTDFTSLPDGTEYESRGVVVGGAMGSGAENVISGNSSYGISILTADHVIQGNFIGTDASGSTALPNSVGIHLSGSSERVLIGGTDPGLGNLISGNFRGVTLLTDHNSVVGNFVGTNQADTGAIGNDIGVWVFGNDNKIGIGPGTAGNVISGNGTGISIQSGAGNSVMGNRIGTNADGSIPIPNGIGLSLGFERGSDPTNTVVGAPGTGNWIEHNRECGAFVADGVEVAEFVENTIADNGAVGLGFCSGQGIILADWGSGISRVTISRNSIYDNAGLGIQLTGGADVNQGIDPPVLTNVTLEGVKGTACPGCKVEIFLADIDPSGSGEGKTYLAETIAAGDGSFSVALAGLRACDALTATATDGNGNTSEFARNLSLPCLSLPPFIVLIGIPGLVLGGGVLGFFLARRWRRGRVLAAVAGGLLAGGAGALLLAMPFVRVTPPAGQTGDAGGGTPFIPCGQYFDAAGISPADGSVFALGTDVRIEAYPPAELEGEVRWRLEATGPDGTAVEKEFSGAVNTALSELGFDPSAPGTYVWRISGERLDPKTQQWMPLCRDAAGRTFLLRPAQSDGGEAQNPNGQTPADDGGPTAPDSTAPVATLLGDANCRKGPGIEYSTVTMLPQGGTYPIDGRSEDGNWWWVRLPGDLGHCWVAGQNVSTSGETAGVEVIEPPPLGCWIKPNPNTPEECVVPCPEGADSSKVCEA